MNEITRSDSIREASRFRRHPSRLIGFTLSAALLIACSQRDGVPQDRVAATQGAAAGSGSAENAPSPSQPAAELPPSAAPDAFGSMGEPCAQDGARACARGSDRKGMLACQGATWQDAGRCGDSEQCSTASGEEVGRCKPIVSECQSRPTREAFCGDGKLRFCIDAVSIQERSCSENAVCMSDGELARCACAPGFTDVGGHCSDVDECAIANGGCDASAPCKNVPGGHTCGGCQMGFIGGAEGKCTPALIGLSVTPGALDPVFSPATTKYRVVVPLTTPTVDVTAIGPEGATLTINDQPAQLGKAWRSPVLSVGENAIGVVIAEGESGETRYALTVVRGEGEESYVKAPDPTLLDGFGGSVALSETRLVIGAPAEDVTPKPAGMTATEGPAPAPAGVAATRPLVDAGVVYVYERAQNGWSTPVVLTASNAGANDRFGAIVAISGDTIAVGAPGEAGAGTGADATGANDAVRGSGAAYVFVRDGDHWTQQAYLKASNPSVGDGFGTVIAISGDTIVVGAQREASAARGVNPATTDDSAPGSGAAYVFVREGDRWTQQALLKASDARAGDAFGFAVALDRDTIVVGAVGDDGAAMATPPASGATAAAAGGAAAPAPARTGTAYVFRRVEGAWAEQAVLKPPGGNAGAYFGYSVGVSGNTVLIGAPYETVMMRGESGMAAAPVQSGAAHVYVESRGTWTEQALLTSTADPAMLAGAAGDAFGASVKVLGDVALIGAFGEDSNAAGLGGDQANATAQNSGAAYLFVRDAKHWLDPTFIKASNTRAGDQFGRHTALAKNGLAVGAANERSGSGGLQGNQGDSSAYGSGAVYVVQ